MVVISSMWIIVGVALSSKSKCAAKVLSKGVVGEEIIFGVVLTNGLVGRLSFEEILTSSGLKGFGR